MPNKKFISMSCSNMRHYAYQCNHLIVIDMTTECFINIAIRFQHDERKHEDRNEGKNK